MTEEKELVLPARTIETPPTVEGPPPQPQVVGHGRSERPNRSKKIDPHQNTGISSSRQRNPPRELNLKAGYDPGERRMITEQELIERAEREDAVRRKCEEVETRKARWEGKAEEEILLMEVELHRPGTLEDPTWSFYPTSDGFQAHLWGVTESVTPNQLAYARQGNWHILARGIIQRLSRKRTRQMDLEQTPRAEVYKEQVRLLRPLVELAGAGDALFQDISRATHMIREPSTKAKTEVHHLMRFLEAFIREETRRCQKVKGEEVPEQEVSTFQGLEAEAEKLRAENGRLRHRLEAIEAAMSLATNPKE